MSFAELLLQSKQLPVPERLRLVSEVVDSIQVDMGGNGHAVAPNTADITGLADGGEVRKPTISKEEFVREMRKLGPMDDETYAAYKEGIAWNSQIDEDAWK